MKVWKLLVLPALAIFGIGGCDSESTSSPIFKGNVNGIVVAPKLKDTEQRSVNFTCSDLPIPGGYAPLRDINVTYLDVNGTIVSNTTVLTDECGRFYQNVDTTDIALVQISGAGYRTMISDVNGFENRDKSWGIISTVDTNNSFAVRVNSNGESMVYQDGGFFKYTVMDVKTNRAVLGIPEKLVTLYRDKNDVNITHYKFNDLDADIVLTLDDSGSMTSSVQDQNGTNLGTRLDLTFYAAKSFIDELSGNSELGVNIFDGSIDFINLNFINGMGFTDSGAAVSIPYASDGFENNKDLSKFVVDIYHPDSEVYDINGSVGNPLPAEFPYKATQSYKWGGATALYDVAYASANTLSNRKAERKISILMTDGADTASTRTSFAETIDLAKQQEVVFYTIAMGPDLESSELENLAQQTGGAFFAADGADIGEKFGDVLSDIQYFYEVSTDIEKDTTANYRVDVLLDGETVSGFTEYNSTVVDPDGPDGGESEGALLYKKCAPCHGVDGQTSAYGVSELISSMETDTLKDALMKYKAGTRNLYGYGDVMKIQIETYSDAQIDLLSVYIPALYIEDNTTIPDENATILDNNTTTP